MGRKAKWELDQDKRNAVKKKAMSSLTVEQLHAIKETHKTLRHVLSMIADCNDMYLSDVRKLDDVFWEFRNAFNLGEK